MQFVSERITKLIILIITASSLSLSSYLFKWIRLRLAVMHVHKLYLLTYLGNMIVLMFPVQKHKVYM